MLVTLLVPRLELKARYITTHPVSGPNGGCQLWSEDREGREILNEQLA